MINLTNDLLLCGYKAMKQIDKGHLENFVLGCSVESSQEVYVKIINQKNVSDEAVDRELEISTLLKHPNIVKTLTVYRKPKYAFVVMEKMNGCLSKYMSQKGSLSEELCKKLFLQLTLALDYMHNIVEIAHGGITVSSVLLDANLNLKLADFAHSKSKHENWNCSEIAPNANYIGPEISTVGRYDPIKADMFSLGIVLYFMLTKKYPKRMAANKIDTDRIYLLPVSHHCRQLLVGLLHPNPITRFDCERIVQHDWVENEMSLASKIELFLHNISIKADFS